MFDQEIANKVSYTDGIGLADTIKDNFSMILKKVLNQVDLISKELKLTL